MVLVVAEPDVVERLVTLDEVVLEGQRLHLGVGDHELEVRDVLDHPALVELRRARRLEVRPYPVAQDPGLAHVDDLASLGPEQIHAGPSRKLLELVGEAHGFDYRPAFGRRRPAEKGRHRRGRTVTNRPQRPNSSPSWTGGRRKMAHQFYGPRPPRGDLCSGKGTCESPLESSSLSPFRPASDARTPPLDSPPIPRASRILSDAGRIFPFLLHRRPRGISWTSFEPSTACACRMCCRSDQAALTRDHGGGAARGRRSRCFLQRPILVCTFRFLSAPLGTLDTLHSRHGPGLRERMKQAPSWRRARRPRARGPGGFGIEVLGAAARPSGDRGTVHSCTPLLKVERVLVPPCLRRSSGSALSRPRGRPCT